MEHGSHYVFECLIARRARSSLSLAVCLSFSSPTGPADDVTAGRVWETANRREGGASVGVGRGCPAEPKVAEGAVGFGQIDEQDGEAERVREGQEYWRSPLRSLLLG